MNFRKIALGATAYTVVTFTIAVLWHVVIFETQYLSFGYFEGEPNFLLGFVTILVQGVVLSMLYPMVQMPGSSTVHGLKFALIIGVFFWTSHVLAFLAKQEMQDAVKFAIMETFYLALQFGIFGLLIGRIYRQQAN